MHPMAQQPKRSAAKRRGARPRPRANGEKRRPRCIASSGRFRGFLKQDGGGAGPGRTPSTQGHARWPGVGSPRHRPCMICAVTLQALGSVHLVVPKCSCRISSRFT